MRHTDDKQAIHALLDVVLNAIAELGDEYNVAFDLSSVGWNVRAMKDSENYWSFYENHSSNSFLEMSDVIRIDEHLNELADANPHD